MSYSALMNFVRSIFSPEETEARALERTRADLMLDSEPKYELRHRFYRHIRFYNEIGETSPFGGVTLYVEADFGDIADVRFSYVICHMADQYKKSVARKVAKARYAEGEVYAIKNYDHDVTLEENLQVALKTFLSDKVSREGVQQLEILSTGLKYDQLTGTIHRLYKNVVKAFAQKEEKLELENLEEMVFERTLNVEIDPMKPVQTLLKIFNAGALPVAANKAAA